MVKKVSLILACLLISMAANAYVVTWPVYGEVDVQDVGFADDNSSIVSDLGDAYYVYQYCPTRNIATVTSINHYNASVTRDFAIVPEAVIVNNEAYRVVGLGNSSFASALPGVKSILFPSGLEFIAGNVFGNAPNLESLTIPGSVKSLSYNAFAGLNVNNSALRTLTLADSSEPLTISGSSASNNTPFSQLPLTTLYIGRSFNSSTSIIFSGNNTTIQRTLTNLTIGGSSSIIYDNMFRDFTSLQSVNIGSAVTRIGQCAFANDSAMATLTLNEGVKFIDDYAFYRCQRVEAITLPASLDSIHSNALTGMTGVKTLHIADADNMLNIFGVGSGLYGYALLCGMKSLDDAYVGRNLSFNSEESRAPTAFYGSAVRNLTVGNRVTTLNNKEFYNCSRLEQAQLGEGITSIGNYAFADNVSLKAIAIPAAVTRIGQYAFANDSAMATLTLNEGVKFIDDYAFYRCQRVEAITLPASLDSIHSTALTGMTGVKTLHIADADNMLNIFGLGSGLYGYALLCGMTSLDDAYVGRNLSFNSEESRAPTAFYGSAVRRLTVGNRVTTLNNKEFYNCSRLEQAQLGEGITSIGNYAFADNVSLKAIAIPAAVTRIGQYAFANDSAMVTLTLNEGVKFIDYFAFYRCQRVEAITLPASLDSIHSTALTGMTGVKTLHIADADNMLNIFGLGSGLYGYALLCGMTSLDDAYVGRNLSFNSEESRAPTAFYGSAVRNLTVGNRVTTLNNKEFYNCSRLECINSLNTTPPVCGGSNTFGYVDKTNCVLHVPMYCRTTYANAQVWRDFINIIDDLPNDESSIPGDINGDGKIDVTDLNMAINMLVNNINNPEADVNGDGEVDISDINMIINALLNQ